jgi:hypothetical protein
VIHGFEKLIPHALAALILRKVIDMESITKITLENEINKYNSKKVVTELFK